jgi:hypothetical protein
MLTSMLKTVIQTLYGRAAASRPGSSEKAGTTGRKVRRHPAQAIGKGGHLLARKPRAPVAPPGRTCAASSTGSPSPPSPARPAPSISARRSPTPGPPSSTGCRSACPEDLPDHPGRTLLTIGTPRLDARPPRRDKRTPARQTPDSLISALHRSGTQARENHSRTNLRSRPR